MPQLIPPALPAGPQYDFLADLRSGQSEDIYVAVLRPSDTYEPFPVLRTTRGPRQWHDAILASGWKRLPPSPGSVHHPAGHKWRGRC